MPKKYKLIREPRLEDFENQINHYLNEKWELYGNPFIEENLLYQAIYSNQKNAPKS